MLTAHLSPQTLEAALSGRYATKLFDSEKIIPAGTWNALEQALRLAPSSFGLQPWKFIVVRDPATREKLLPESWGQRQVVDASHFVVFARRTTTTHADIDAYIAEIVATRGIAAASLDGYKAMMNGFIERNPDISDWAAHQVYIALGQFLAACATVGVDACPLEGLMPAKYDEILGLKGTRYATQVACAVGYRSVDDKYASAAKVRFPASAVIEYR